MSIYGGVSMQKLDEQLTAMTLAEKIGQLVITGLEGYCLDQDTRTLLEEYHVGGFILFARNIESAGQALALVNSLKQANSGGKVPLLLSVDEEGGRVSRMPADFARLPANSIVGNALDCTLAENFGRILARRVKALGFNLNYAPVLDVNSNPDNPVIGSRSFSAEPGVVSALGTRAMEGIRAEGVIPVVKHFPGHGDTNVDSHIGLPRVDADLERLLEFELLPFRAAIRAGADAIMTAHILLPKLDPDNPATLSRPLITGLLRDKLHFDGVVITDDLTMGAIKEHYSMGEAAVQAINAGVDIVLVCHGYTNYIAVLEALRKAVETGALPMARIDQAVHRVLRLKCRYNLRDNPTEVPDIQGLNSMAEAIKNCLTVS